MKTPISAIRNLGPKSEAAFARAGIHSAEELRELGAEDAYRRLLLSGRRPHFIGFYVIVLGLQGRPWNDLEAVEKSRLRVVFDRLVAETAGRERRSGELEAALDAFGVMLSKERNAE